jgi:uncharacterized protein with von Willebrand factor type A (vWA) domain
MGSLFSKPKEKNSIINLGTEENKNKILNKLKYTYPSGSTALRDAIFYGTQHQIQLKASLAQDNSEILDYYKFCTIVITDGEDTSSTITSNQIKYILYQLSDKFPNACDTFLIGVDLNSTAQSELKEFEEYGKGSVYFHNVNNMDIGTIFEHIQYKIGISARAMLFQTSNDETYIAAQREIKLYESQQRYIILFVLDISGSMSGQRWKCVQNAMSNFFNKMMPSDIFSVLLFNDKYYFL